jgi:hypothetical protein
MFLLKKSKKCFSLCLLKTFIPVHDERKYWSHSRQFSFLKLNEKKLLYRYMNNEHKWDQ